MENPKSWNQYWYYVPPYGNDSPKILDADGQLVAVFEEKYHAMQTVELHNQNVDQ